MAALSQVLQFTYRDNNGKEAQVQLRFLPNLSYDTVIAFGFAYVALSNQLSNALLYDMKYISTQFGADINPASTQSNVYRKLVCFCTNGEYVSSVSLPSPGLLSFDLDGPWRGFRIDNTNGDLPGMQALANVLTSGAEDAAGRLYSGSIVYATLAENVI